MHRVFWLPRAEHDFNKIYHWLADMADAEVAIRHARLIIDAAARLADFLHRGSPRDDIAQGLRSIPYANFATIFYSVDEQQVLIERIIHPRRNLRAAFEEPQ